MCSQSQSFPTSAIIISEFEIFKVEYVRDPLKRLNLNYAEERVLTRDIPWPIKQSSKTFCRNISLYTVLSEKNHFYSNHIWLTVLIQTNEFKRNEIGSSPRAISIHLHSTVLNVAVCETKKIFSYFMLMAWELL